MTEIKPNAKQQECIDNNIEIVTSAPTFEIWYLMHYRNNRLKFQTSKEVKRELQKINFSVLIKQKNDA